MDDRFSGLLGVWLYALSLREPDKNAVKCFWVLEIIIQRKQEDVLYWKSFFFLKKW